MNILGDIDCSGNPNYPAATIGDIYRVSVAGKIGGASGYKVSVGDMIVCFTTSVAGTQAAVGANWNIKQVGLQRVIEVTFSTGDVLSLGLNDWQNSITRDWTNNIGRDLGLTVVRDVAMVVGGTWTQTVTGTYAVSGSNFAVGATGKVTAGLANRTMTVGLGSGFVPAIADNTFIGVNIAATLTTGNSNVGVGSIALSMLTTGNNNTAVGRSSLFSLTTGSGNTALGDSALQTISTTSNNTAVGFQCMLAAVGTGGTGFGYRAFYNNTGNSNVGVGHSVGHQNTSGNENCFIGFQSFYQGLTVSGSIGLGTYAGFYETGNNKFYVWNASGASEADGRLKALMYGIMAATTPLQFLTINAHTLISEDLQFTTKAINITSGDAATINSPAGRFRKDATGATFTLTNSYITANSIIVLTPANAAVDVTGTVFTVLAGAGSAVITWVAAPTADFDMNFLVIN